MNGTSDIKSILLYKSKSIYSILIFFISVLVRWLLLEQDFLGPPSGQPGHVQVVVVQNKVVAARLLVVMLILWLELAGFSASFGVMLDFLVFVFANCLVMFLTLTTL